MTDRKRFIQFLIFETVFWFAAAALFNAWQYTGGVAICVLFAIWFLSARTPERRFLVLLSGLPFQAIIKVSPSLPSATIALYFLFILFYLLDHKFMVKRKNVIAVMILIFLNLIGYVRYQADFSNIFSGLLMVVFAACAIEMFAHTDRPIALFEQSLSVLAVSLLVDIYSVSVFPQLPYYILLRKQLILDRLGRFCALNGDPNYYGQLILVAIGLLISLFILNCRGRRYRKGFLYAIVAIVLSVNGLRSISKGYVIGLASLLVLTIWFLIMENKSAKQKPYWFALFLLVGMFASTTLARSYVMPILSKRTETDFFSGRLDIWKSYLNLFSDHLEIVFSGSGFFNTHPYMKATMGVSKAAHNLFIEVLGDVGLIGVITVGSLWSCAVSKLKMLGDTVASLFFWGFLITSLGLSASANDLIYYVIPLFSALFTSSEYLEYINCSAAPKIIDMKK